jgi:hypothetical protein
MRGFYVLEKDRSLKFTRDFREKPGEVRRWKITDELKISALWRIAIEAVALGLSTVEAEAQLRRWGLDEQSGFEFAREAGLVVERIPGGGAFEQENYYVSGVRIEEGKPPVQKIGTGPTILVALSTMLYPGIHFQHKTA